MKIERQLVGPTMFLLSWLKDGETKIHPSFDVEGDPYTWWTLQTTEARRNEVREHFLNLVSRTLPSDYKKMYLSVSGCKEAIYTVTVDSQQETFIWGIFHRDGKIKGWYHHQQKQDKKDGEFYIIKSSIFQLNNEDSFI